MSNCSCCPGPSPSGTDSMSDMKMYMHTGIGSDIILFQWWKPSSPLAFYLSCLVCLAAGFLSMYLKYLRNLLERHLSADLPAKSALTDPPSPVPLYPHTCLHPSDRASEEDRATSADSSHSMKREGLSESLGSPLLRTGGSGAADTVVRVGEQLQRHQAEARSSGGELQTEEAAQRRSQEHRVPWQVAALLRCALSVLSTGIDFALMLVCMTFNVGLFAAVVVGLGVGSAVFGHVVSLMDPCCVK
ncbi:unnamed protein product [Vitrella brassicaformis CCMP3155]|uniref:Copper transport protein n=2 Tax=Vitrella brassicaformis TaxID=1169539 RepID=A0A0G4H7L8_VITBC|nr:unnamed protein product [Vitrella brassicaformis CCMP3155]|mmetsp:Transcript_2424/g.5503  ORF Transcript_2424/g.5503 Transcript_2424/m.5503 type:complete len:245 (+) Transcript_2424:185-919(+)|eukprot:CEM39663.1 unnamed protein product [Vitrella brassicaformis CCMP3155]